MNSSVELSFSVKDIISAHQQTRERTYESVHTWLRKVFGVAYKCENKGCVDPSIHFQWAKLKGREYDFNRDNFVMLCGRCHYYYDDKHKKHWRVKK